MDGLLTDLGVAGVLREIGDIAVHLAIDLDALHDLFLVGLQTAVHVVQLDAGDLAGGPVVELGREVLGELVVLAVLLPAAHDVVAVLLDHLVKLRDLVGGVLEVGVHGDDHVALGLLESAVERGGFAVVAAELDAVHGGVGLGEFGDAVPRTVVAAVIHHYHFMAESVRFHHAPDPGV